MSSATERRILCYITDRLALVADSGLAGEVGGVAGSSADFETARIARLLERIRSAIDAGIDWIQIREKDLSGKQLAELARSAVAAANAAPEAAGTSRRRTRIVVNDRLDVAVAARAGGVHLGRESVPLREVVSWRAKEKQTREELADFLIGASCHSLEQARAAVSDGADYLIFGPVFETPSKIKFGPPLGIEQLREACAQVQIPILAIGGITAENASSCYEAGASGIAAIRLFQESQSAAKLRNLP